MMLRLVRRAVAAARQFSAKSVATAAPEAEPQLRSGMITSVSRSTKSTSAGGARDTLGRLLFPLVYAKRSAVITIRKWKEEGRVVRKYDLNRIVRQLRRLKRYKHALEKGIMVARSIVGILSHFFLVKWWTELGFWKEQRMKYVYEKIQ